MAADRERLIGFGGALLVHLALVGLLAFSMQKKPEAPASPAATPIVQARAVSEAEVMEPMRRRQAEEEAAKRRAEEEQRQAAEAQRMAAEEAKRKAAEQARLAEQKKRQAAEQARLAEQERQRKLEAEKQRKAEAERKAAEERKRAAAEAERKRREAEESLRQAMAAENERLAQEQQRRRQQQLLGVRQQYVADIRNKVERSWRRETGSRGSHCRVLIHQIPSGEVIDVRLNECDGDVAFQRSVEAAVRKASPLPLPSDPEVFEREIEFVFEP
ncbi:MAG TPA: cell envelope integrity protein TolA [Gammaproteobacteria bacterium]